MKFYLKWINPIVALVILAICCWVYFGGYFISLDGSETPFTKGKHLLDAGDEGFQMYFFAKGLFCSSMLFLFGEFLKKYLNKETTKDVSNN
jgi:hypothetical protein